MTTRKRNEFLDPLISDDDDEASDKGYDSEAAEESKGRTVKRRRRDVTQDAGSDESEDEDDDEGDKGGVKLKENKPSTAEDENEEHEDENEREPSTTPQTKSRQKLVKPVKPSKKNKTGIIYLSSLPPYLKPSALKSLLLQRNFGPINRIFLTPATPTTSSSKRSNKRKTYTDGWVEFTSKRTAKICAETLNATIVGGKKGGWYHDDVWNMKYLRGMKWDDLMDQVQRERAEREAKRRIEDSRAKKEEKIFIEGVEKGRVVEGIRKKNEERGRVGGNDEEVRRLFRQNEVKSGGKAKNGKKDGDNGEGLDEDAKRVLGKIF